MKKVIITVLFICTAAMCSALPNFGAKIGANMSKFSVSSSEMKYSFQPGFDVGFFARLKHHKLYVQPEVFYSYQATKNDLGKFKTHSINVPVLVGYKLVDVKMTNVRVFLGPEFNYILNENTDLRSPANITGCIGAGIDVAMITFDLRYGYTFNKAIETSDKTNPYHNTNAHNNVISLSLGWKFL